MKLASVRASALPMAFRCPGSQRAEFPIDPHHDAAAAGTAAHKCLEALPSTGEIRWGAVPDIAARYGADEQEVRILSALGAKLWKEVSETFSGAQAEVDLEAEVAPGVLLTGHVDLLTINDRVGRAGDWKTGRKDSDYAAQMRAYGLLVLLKYPELDEVTVTALWVRDQEIENYTMRRAEARRWLEKLVDDVVNWDGVYHPGSHCQYCRRWHECEAATAYVRRDVEAIANIYTRPRDAISDPLPHEIDKMAPDEVISLYEKADLVEKLAKRVRDAVRERALQHGEIAGTSKRIAVSTEQRREIDPEKAWPVLEAAGFEDEDFAASMKLSISKVEKRIAQKARRGRGAAAVRELTKQLAEAGAVKTNELKKLQIKRI